MSREVRRVPLDFDWPLNKTWDGYLMPEHLRADPCPDCSIGYTDAAEWVQGVAYVIAGLADDAGKESQGRQLHPWLQPLREIPYNQAKGRPGAQFAEFADGFMVDARQNGFLGRDVYAMMRGLIQAAGLPEDWGTCPSCNGSATQEAYLGQGAEAEAWVATAPPIGEGWQYWETVSEGSPISPVFATADELSWWLQTDYQLGASGPLTKEQADNMVKVGWAPSGFITDAGVTSGDAYVS